MRFSLGPGDYLYLKSYRKRGYEIPDELLFDLNHDPHQTQDVAATHPELVSRGRLLLKEWTTNMLKDGTYPDPLQTVLREPDETELMNAKLGSS